MLRCFLNIRSVYKGGGCDENKKNLIVFLTVVQVLTTVYAQQNTEQASDEADGMTIHEVLTNYLASKDLNTVITGQEPIALSVDDVVRFKSRETRGATSDALYEDEQYVPTIKYDGSADSLSNTITFKHNNGLMTTYTFIHMTKPGLITLTIQKNKRNKSGTYTIDSGSTKTYQFQVKAQK